MLSWGRSEEGRKVRFVRFGRQMKQLNVWPLLMLLIAVAFIIYWLRPHS